MPSSSLRTARRRASCTSGARWARTTDGVTSSPDARDARGPVACAPNRARTSTARHHGAPAARAELGRPGETPQQIMERFMVEVRAFRCKQTKPWRTRDSVSTGRAAGSPAPRCLAPLHRRRRHPHPRDIPASPPDHRAASCCTGT